MATHLESCYTLQNRSSTASETIETFTPHPLTCSPWSTAHQHGGPVTGILARAILKQPGKNTGRLSRITVELLGPVMVQDFTIRSWTDRAGSTIELRKAELIQELPDGSTRIAARASGWIIRTADTAAVAYQNEPPMHRQDAQLDLSTVNIPDIWQAGFFNTLDWQLATPVMEKGAPTQGWCRMTMNLVDGEPTSSLMAAITMADVANGIGSRADGLKWAFINTELSIHIHTPPQGEWLGLAAESAIGPDGIGTSAALLYDDTQAIGRIAQAFILSPNPLATT